MRDFGLSPSYSRPLLPSKICPRNLFVIFCYQMDSLLILNDMSSCHIPIRKHKISPSEVSFDLDLLVSQLL